MNLGRAKTALILAFLGLNLLLAYYLFWPEVNRLSRVAVSREDLRRVEAELTRNNFALEAALARSVQKSTFVTVSPASGELNRLRLLLAGESSSITEEEGVTVYRRPGKTARFHPGGLVQIAYTAGPLISVSGAEIADDEAAAKVEEFLKEEDLKPSQAVFSYLKRGSGGNLSVYYHRNNGGQIFFSSYVRVEVSEGRVRVVEIFWLEPVEWPQERAVEIISAAEAVRRLVREIGPSLQPRRVIQVSLGYYSQEYNAERWEVPPVWRIMLDRFEIYYINALTGFREAGPIR